jgi:hypothetical protein
VPGDGSAENETAQQMLGGSVPACPPYHADHINCALRTKMVVFRRGPTVAQRPIGQLGTSTSAEIEDYPHPIIEGLEKSQTREEVNSREVFERGERPTKVRSVRQFTSWVQPAIDVPGISHL